MQLNDRKNYEKKIRVKYRKGKDEIKRDESGKGNKELCDEKSKTMECNRRKEEVTDKNRE